MTMVYDIDGDDVCPDSCPAGRHNKCFSSKLHAIELSLKGKGNIVLASSYA